MQDFRIKAINIEKSQYARLFDSISKMNICFIKLSLLTMAIYHVNIVLMTLRIGNIRWNSQEIIDLKVYSVNYQCTELKYFIT